MSLRGFYGIADKAFGSLEDQVISLLGGGACAIQLRWKSGTLPELQKAAHALLPLCREANTPLLLNDFFLPHCSDGMHLGQDDGAFDRHSLPPNFIVGRSTHNLLELSAAIAEGVDYVGFGPVFSTQTKTSAGGGLGLQALATAARAPVPMVAIGGISLERLPDVRATGVDAWTAISAIWTAESPDDAIRAFSLL